MAMLVAINMSIYESMNIIPSLSRFFPSFGSSETITFHYMPLLNTLWPKSIDPLGGNIRKYLDGHCTEKKENRLETLAVAISGEDISVMTLYVYLYIYRYIYNIYIYILYIYI